MIWTGERDRPETGEVAGYSKDNSGNNAEMMRYTTQTAARLSTSETLDGPCCSGNRCK